jgi:hypothetical protein
MDSVISVLDPTYCLEGIIKPVYFNIADSINENWSYYDKIAENFTNNPELNNTIIKYNYVIMSVFMVIMYGIGIAMGYIICEYRFDTNPDSSKTNPITNNSGSGKGLNFKKYNVRTNFTDINNSPAVDMSKLYVKTIDELRENRESIRSKFRSNENYYSLLRVKLALPVTMKKTKYDIPESKGKNFTTSELYMIVGFRTYEITEYNHEIYLENILLKIINTFNQLPTNHFKITDFVLVATGSKPNIQNNEFFRGLININYELFNIKAIEMTTRDNKEIRFVMPLVINDINKLFMDVYNDILFESKKYKIDVNNYETWDNKNLRNLLK